MKRISLIQFMAITAIATISYAFLPSKGVLDSNLNPDDYKYYFIFNNQVRDVRTFDMVSDQIETSPNDITFLSKDKRYLMSGNHNSRLYKQFALNGTKKTTFQLNKGEVIAPWWTHKVFIKNNDVWAADLDWNTGKETNHRQLTQLGTFNPMYGIGFAHWYENQMVILIEQKCYLLNTSTGNLQAMLPSDSDCSAYNHFNETVSPDGRYSFRNNAILDMKDLSVTNTDIGLVPGNSIRYWKDDNTVLLHKAIDPNHRRDLPPRTFLLDMTTGKETVTFDFDFLMPYWFKNDLGKESRCFSPSGRYILYCENGDRNSRTKYMWVGDTENHINIKTHVTVSGHAEQIFKFAWLNDGTFIYSVKGDPLTQGTWVYDVHTKKKKKITPFLANNFVVMKGVNKVVFVANNQLYKSDLDGNNLKQMTSQPLGRWKQSIKTFL